MNGEIDRVLLKCFLLLRTVVPAVCNMGERVLPTVTASWVVAGIDRVTILSLYQSAVYNETKYRRLRLSCCNRTSYYIATTK